MIINNADAIDPPLLMNLHLGKKHQYDVLVYEYKIAAHNKAKTLTWLGNEHTTLFAHYLIEYLSPRFKDMK